MGLLAVEGFLLLSKWFQWFAFNEKKGYTVLIAVAAVCLVVVVMVVWLVVGWLFRWRFQFSLRSLVVLVVVVAVPLGLFGIKMREAERQRRAVEATGETGGSVLYDYHYYGYGYQWDGAGFLIAQKPPGPTWLRELLGDDFFADVFAADYSDTNVSYPTDTDVGDVALEHVERLTELRSLELSGPQVTDVGLENLKGLTKLEWLGLPDSQVTDAGLMHLKGLTRLEYLNLHGTQVTAQGIRRLRKALPNCEIVWEEDPNPQHHP